MQDNVDLIGETLKYKNFWYVINGIINNWVSLDDSGCTKIMALFKFMALTRV